MTTTTDIFVKVAFFSKVISDDGRYQLSDTTMLKMLEPKYKNESFQNRFVRTINRHVFCDVRGVLTHVNEIAVCLEPQAAICVIGN